MLGVLGLALGNALIPHDSGIDERARHIKEIVLAIGCDLVQSAALVPAEDVEVINGPVERALITEHVVELVDDGGLEDDVLPGIRLHHGLELVDLGDEL